jgi:two-component system chemotaxis sensor kinase CheA
MPIDREALAQRLMATFIAELDEHVRALDRGALALEKPAEVERDELAKSLFRTVHSLKGAARSVGLDVVAGACHALEELLAGARDGHVELGGDEVQLLFATADALRDTADRLRERRELDGSPIADLLARLDERSRSRARSEPVRPGAAPAPRDPGPGGDVAVPPPPPLPTPAPDPPRRRSTESIPSRGAAPAARDGTVRIAAEKLDRLMTYSGEMLIARRRIGARRGDASELRAAVATLRDDAQRLDRLVRKQVPRAVAAAIERLREGVRTVDRGIDRLSFNLRADHHLLEQTASNLDDEIRRSRMLPFAEVAEGLERAARDAARAVNKEVEFVATGAMVELDRSVLSQLGDPLLHLVRNAVDHGIESPAVREQAGKPRAGRITVRVETRGAGVEVTVEDDGRGIDLEAVREQARRRGIAVPRDEDGIARLVFAPGLSTAGVVTELSGRGVGLDVVRHQVERLHGSIDVSSTPRRGARFVLLLPLTLTTLRALLARVAGRTYALPSVNLVRLARIRLDALGWIEGRPVLLGMGPPIPVAELADVLGIRRTERTAADKVSLAVVEVGDRRLALIADELIAEQEVVTKGMGPRLQRVRHFTGATVLPTGEIALIVSMPELIATGIGMRTGLALAAAGSKTAARRLLVADDSVTTRTLEKTVLEAAGYEVITASDGAEAWHLLQERGADLVISDVEMPRMDGFALTEAVRGSRRFRNVPVILLTALDNERDRARGLEVGADAYLVKSAFDQGVLLGTVEQLL